MQTKSEFAQFFRTEIEPKLEYDKPALRQAWNDTIDLMCKAGELPARALNWSHPRRFYRYGSEQNPLRKSGRVRTTVDEYQIHGFYNGTWEEVTAEDTRTEARELLKEYRENEPGTMFKLVVKRVKKS